MSYNLTNIVVNATGPIGIVQGINSVLMFDMLGIFLLIALSSITFITFIQTTGDTGKSMAATGFISLILSLMLYTLGLVPPLAFYISLIIAAGAIALSYRQG